MSAPHVAVDADRQPTAHDDLREKFATVHRVYFILRDISRSGVHQEVSVILARRAGDEVDCENVSRACADLLHVPIGRLNGLKLKYVRVNPDELARRLLAQLRDALHLTQPLTHRWL